MTRRRRRFSQQHNHASGAAYLWHANDIHKPSADDPTKNVMDMVNSEVQRQDDLRTMESVHIREIMTIRSEMLAMHNQCQQELTHQEAARIDAIRAVDVAAWARAAEVSAMQASTLASQVAQAAEAMRNQVAAAAAAAATALATSLEPIQKSIEDLRKAQYENIGQKVAQIEGREMHQGGQSNTVALIAVVASVLFGVAGLALAIIKMS